MSEQNKLIKNIEKTFMDCLALIKAKNTDYATKENPFANFEFSQFVQVSPDRAILVRITDKLARISNLLDKPNTVSDEKIEDTINDCINYLAILKEYLNSKKS